MKLAAAKSSVSPVTLPALIHLSTANPASLSLPCTIPSCKSTQPTLLYLVPLRPAKDTSKSPPSNHLVDKDGRRPRAQCRLTHSQPSNLTSSSPRCPTNALRNRRASLYPQSHNRQQHDSSSNQPGRHPCLRPPPSPTLCSTVLHPIPRTLCGSVPLRCARRVPRARSMDPTVARRKIGFGPGSRGSSP
jgi:hypothetical protein